MRILHLSDIHFGISELKSTHHWSQKDGSRPDPLALALLLQKDLIEAPDVLVISGDLGWSGVSEDYGLVLRFLEALRERPEWKAIEVVVAPGNHDVDLTSTAGPPERRQDSFVDFLGTLYGPRFERVYPLLAAAPPSTDLERRSRIIGVHEITCSDDEQVLIVTANSAARLVPSDRSTPCPVDLDRLDDIMGQVKLPAGPRKQLRLLVVHHHLLPFYEQNWGTHDDRDTPKDFVDPTMVSNSAKLQTWLARNGFQLVLHGHKHIPHSREDVLYRRDEPPRRIVAIGAGSAGVVDRERKFEPLSYNVLEVWQLSYSRWAMKVKTRRVPDSAPDTPSAYREPHILELGSQPQDSPMVFWAEELADCHRAIAKGVERDRTYREFLSMVDGMNVDSFRAPPTCGITTEEVERAFHALHPEHGAAGWANPDLQRAIESLRTQFQFQHGIRLFNPPPSVSGLPPTSRNEYEPITRAIKLLEPHKSRAYVGLYDPSIDVTGVRQPPTMTGIQFVSDGKHLDVVVTFRKIELSTWWVINMFEVGKLLAWASTLVKDRPQPRRITFFASLAEWKTEPKPTIVPRLDSIELSTLTSIVAAANASEAHALEELAEMLDEKARLTNEDNVDLSGLVRLGELVGGIAQAQQGAMTAELRDCLRKAIDAMKGALEKTRDDQRRAALQQAQELLKKATSIVRT